MTKEFENFADRVTDELIDRLQEDGYGHITVGVRSVETAGGSYEAVNVKLNGTEMAVSANLSKAYETYLSGMPMEEIAENLTLQISHTLAQMSRLDVSFITDYENVKDRLIVDLVSGNQSRNRLRDVPHGNIADMALVCKVMADPDDISKGTILINNSLLQQYGITPEQLQRDALENAARIRPAAIAPMSEVLRQEPLGADEFLFIASSPDAIHGAGVIAYPGFLDQAAQQLGGDFFVLPSSIHEVILAKDNGFLHAEELTDLVQAVNQTEVAPEERLSDTAYHFDSREHVFEKAEQFAARKKRDRGKGSLLENLAEKSQRVSEEKVNRIERASTSKVKGGKEI
ncbi:MAG: DUF5688 family protein [Lachnospiraceae bacterium]|nr:DUF5688 family protein [Lachnospiraceae bacterium]